METMKLAEKSRKKCGYVKFDGASLGSLNSDFIFFDFIAVDSTGYSCIVSVTLTKKEVLSKWMKGIQPNITKLRRKIKRFVYRERYLAFTKIVVPVKGGRLE